MTRSKRCAARWPAIDPNLTITRFRVIRCPGGRQLQPGPPDCPPHQLVWHARADSRVVSGSTVSCPISSLAAPARSAFAWRSAQPSQRGFHGASRSALAQILIGLALGIPAALFAGHLMNSQLYGVGGYDPLALSGAIADAGVMRRSRRIHSRAPRRFHRTHAGTAHRIEERHGDEHAAGSSLRTSPVAQVARASP